MYLKLIDYLDCHVKNNPESIFLNKIETGNIYTYAILHTTSLNCCKYLAGQGYNKGDRLIYLADNEWFIFPLLIACSILGLVLVPISPELHLDDVTRIIKDVMPNAMIGTQKNLNQYEVDIFQLEISQFNVNFSQDIKIEKNNKNSDTLLIVYTSGSSGQCKGVMITESNIIHASFSIIGYYNVLSTDKFFCILPLFHMNAIMVTGMVPLLTGACIILSDIFNFTNATLYFQRIISYKPTIISIIPSIMSVLIKLRKEDVDFSANGVKFSFCGAAPLSAKLWMEFEKTFNVKVCQGYGLTETTFWATMTPMDESRDYNSVGLPYGCDIKIDTNGKKNKSGEILISGACVTKGYYNNFDGFDKEGYFRTGDIGYISENKQLYILGRKKDIIIKSGQNIYPQSIDWVLLQHPNIEDCASVGLQDDVVGERVCTVCVLSENVELNSFAIKDFARKHLSSYMVPDMVLFIKCLPRGATGKIIKKKLLEHIKKVLENNIKVI